MMVVVLSCQRRSIPRSCQSKVLLTHSPFSFSLFFSPFHTFSHLFSFVSLSRQLNICRQTRISWLPLFLLSGYILMGTQEDHAWLYFLFTDQSWWAHEEIVLAFILCFWIDLHFTTLSSNRSLLAHTTDVSTLLQNFGWDDKSWHLIVPVRYCCTVITQVFRWWSLCLTYIEKSLSCSFPVELWSCFSAVTCERWF